MAFSFKYKPIQLKSGIIYRPFIPLTLFGKQSMDILAMLDSGSDTSILPLEMAEEIGLIMKGNNEIAGIGREPVKSKESNVEIQFGKGHELYRFNIPLLIPFEMKNAPIIIGRGGFFNKFKITFNEQKREIEFKKISEPR